jgi:NAD(P)-dependent dehydrogenase (short-subunit alcohol dehydrogenase family)
MGQEKFLQGRAAMITGGASGMGRAIALVLAEAGLVFWVEMQVLSGR